MKRRPLPDVVRTLAVTLTCALAALAAPGHAAAQAGSGPRDSAATRPDTPHPATPQIATDSQPDTLELPELVVTATRMPLRRDAVPVPVTVVTGRELERRGVRTVAEALQAAPSTSVVSAGPAGSQTTLFMRGGESDYVKVLVDGVPVNAPGGFVDLADLSVTNVERIEVVRGPTSVLYGSDAVTGVVQVFTRRGAGPPTFTATAMPGVGSRRGGDGTYPMLELQAAVSGGSDRVSYSLGASRFATDGLLPLNNGYEDRVLSGRVALAPFGGTDLAVTARLNDGRYHYPTDGAGQIVDANAVQDADTRTVAVDAGQRLGQRLHLHLQLAESVTRRAFHDEPDGTADTLGTFAGSGHQRLTRQSADARADLAVAHGTTLSAGATVETGAVDGATEYISAFGPFNGTTDERRTTVGVYAQLVAQPVRGLAVQAGVRREDARTFGVFDTWRLAAAYALPAGLRLRASFGTAFREPSFAESFGSGFGDVGNPDLTPETSRSWDVGIEKEIGSGRVVLTWFDQAFTDLVQYTFATAQPGDPNYYNVGGATARGLELEGRLPLTDAIAVDASASLLRTRVTDQGLATDATFVEGEPLLRRPAVTGDIGVSWAVRAGSIRVAARHTGAREDVDYGAAFPYPRVTLDPVTLLDLAAEYRPPLLDGEATLLLRVSNALDAEYQQIAGFPAPGRVVRLGVRVGGQ